MKRPFQMIGSTLDLSFSCQCMRREGGGLESYWEDDEMGNVIETREVIKEPSGYTTELY